MRNVDDDTHILVRHYDAFSRTPNQGNPAGVVLDATDLSEPTMQAVAKRVGFNECAFVLPSNRADFRLRFFTPGHEMPLCGHATIASILAMFERGRLPQDSLPQSLSIETKAGVLPIALRVDTESDSVLVEMTQAPARFVEFEGSLPALADSLGIRVGDFHPTLPIVYGSTGTWTLIVPVSSLSAVRSMRASNEDFPEILTRMPRSSVHPFSTETVFDDVDLHGRHFSSPFSGTVEDPVTGTASGVMGAFLAKYAPEYCAERNYRFGVEQGFEVGRRGRIEVTVLNRAEPFEVTVSGTGVHVADISLRESELASD